MLPLLLSLLVLPAAARAQSTNGFQYITTNGSVTITGYDCPPTLADAVIPDTITGLPVTRIGDESFQGCTGLTSVTIPNGVTTIGALAFYGCASLTNITIPSNVATIERWAFNACPSVSEITVDALNPHYSSVDGVLFDKGQSTLIRYPEGKIRVDFAIPAGVTNIAESAFYGCANLTSVTIPNSVASIEDNAFAGTSLTSVVIPSSVTAIGVDTFGGCPRLATITVDTQNPVYSSAAGVLFNQSQTALIQYPQGKEGTSYIISSTVVSISDWAFEDSSLISVTLPNSVTSIGFAAFNQCTSLSSVALPDSVINIGGAAFDLCLSLTNLTIGANVTSIGTNAFSSTGLTTISIPDSVTSIGEGAFANCSHLSGIAVGGKNPIYSAAGGVLLDRTRATLVQCPAAKTGNYTIPQSITNIGVVAFAGAKLTTVTIPDSIAGIQAGAFYGCTNLAGVYFQGNAPSLDHDAFAQDTHAIVYYLAGTTGWGTTFGALPTTLWSLPSPLILTTSPAFGLHTNQFGFNIFWSSNQMVIVEATANLAHPSWAPVATNTLTGGTSYFSDPQSTEHPARFYRLRVP